MMFDESSLLAFRRGEITIDALLARESTSIARMVSFFYRRLRKVAAVPIDREDLIQIAHVALWESARGFEWRCPGCDKAFGTEKRFEAHARKTKHGAASPTFVRFVNGCVGNALFHEIRKYSRRSRWMVELPERERSDPDLFEVCVSGRQEECLILREMIEDARRRLDPARRLILDAMLSGWPEGGSVAGIDSRRCRVLRAQVENEFLSAWTA